MNKEELLENLTEQDVQDNLETGIVMAIEEAKSILEGQLEDLSKKELKRLIKNAANFPSPVPVGSREAKATETLYTIKDLQIEMAIVSIGRSQQEADKAEGESNE